MATSGIVFAVVTLPLSVSNSVPQWVTPRRADVVTPLDNSAKPIIRYIGVAIISSVGSGIGVAEVLRRMQQRRRLSQLVSEVQEHQEQASSAADERELPVTKPPAAVLGYHLQSSSLQVPQERLQAAAAPAAEQVLDFPGDVTPEHMMLNGVRIFGVRYGKRHYRLLRSTASKETLLHWSQGLKQQGAELLLTYDGDAQYSLWYYLSVFEQAQVVERSLGAKVLTNGRNGSHG